MGGLESIGDSVATDPRYLEGACIWNNAADLEWALRAPISLNIRQLLLQAYCTFSVYGQREVFIMLVSGIYFTMLKFRCPNDFEPLPQGSNTSNKKRKLEPRKSGEPGEPGEPKEPATGKPECMAANRISNLQLDTLIPSEYVEVIYHNAPVLDDIQARDIRLSDAFRQALRERLDDINFQPCSLFDLRSAQYMPNDEDLVSPIELHLVRYSRASSQNKAKVSVSRWYSRARAEGCPKTPKQQRQPYVESPINNKEAPLSPEYKGKAVGVGSRKSLQRMSKDVTNFLRSANRQEEDANLDQVEDASSDQVEDASSDQEEEASSDQEFLNAGGNTKCGNHQEGSGGAGGTEGEGDASD